MRIDVVRAVLVVVFSDDDQGVRRIGAMGHGLDEPANRQVVVGLLGFRCVDAGQRGAEAARVIMAEANRRQAGQIALLTLLAGKSASSRGFFCVITSRATESSLPRRLREIRSAQMPSASCDASSRRDCRIVVCHGDRLKAGK
ncbi:hypothetical protein EOS_37810 [Caballeronia mineralivorans PML1(12)]|uniref:Uncharacterized protein n=1 Tax=Caballeronia mineralivorans PML1(12) TaxID=908627 RepID=A0A0J1FMT0_9BURK|nr:hypothetical protein EOS_37810 [Caballeronia mineralivorans PML1(12)]